MNHRRIIFSLIIIILAASLNIKQLSALHKGAKIENFVLYDAHGKRCIFYDIVKTLPAKGVLILNFTSIHCKPCKKEIPELLEISKKAGSRVKLVCIYAESGESVKQSAAGLGVLSNAYVDPFGKIQKIFNAKEKPVTFIINKRNIIRGKFVGYTAENIDGIKKLAGVQ